MTGWSFSIGKIFGVEIRVHSFFLFLMVPSALWSVLEGRPALRGFLLWFLLLLAVAVREVARSVASAWFSLDVKSVLLLPTGGLLSYATPEAEARAGERRVQRGMALAGPLANLLFAVMLAGLILTVSPSVSLLESPWVSPAHLLRAMVWMNVFLSALNLLPAWPLDGGRVAHAEMVRDAGADGGPTAGARLPVRLNALKGTGFFIAMALIVCGILIRNWWMLMGGLFVLLGAQMDRQGMLLRRDTDATSVGEVMLTDYSVLPASATLEDAMMHARHSLQDVFPVVRAGNMVGAVGRQSILDALASTGNGYVQGIMTRQFQTAGASDSLMETLNKALGEAGGSLQIVPVVEGDAVVGILTPQHLQRSLGLLPRRLARSGRSSEDETD